MRKGGNNIAGTRRARQGSLVLDVHEQVRRLAVQLAAERLQRREADRPRLVRLQDGEVGERDPHPLAQLGQRHPPLLEHPVQHHLDRHGQTTSDCSSSSSAPLRKTSASATSTSDTKITMNSMRGPADTPINPLDSASFTASALMNSTVVSKMELPSSSRPTVRIRTAFC